MAVYNTYKEHMYYTITKNMNQKTLIDENNINMSGGDSDVEEEQELIIELERMSVNELAEHSADCTKPLRTRMRALEYFCTNHPMESVETINKLAMMYMFSRVKSLENYMYKICVASSVPVLSKIVLAGSLCSSGEDVGYDAMNFLCQNFENTPTPIRVESILTLMECDKYKNESLSYLVQIANNQSLDCMFRYKTILAIELRSGLDAERKKFYLRESMLQFFANTSNDVSFRILSAQYLRQKCDSLSMEDIQRIESDVLNTIAMNMELPYNVRGDAADMLMRLGLEENQFRAMRVIRDMGIEDMQAGKMATVYTNRQNVHTVEIEKTAIDAIEYMLENQKQSEYNDGENIMAIKKTIDDYIKQNLPEDSKITKKNIDIAFNRIMLDRALYSRYNCTLETVFVRVWIEIKKNTEHFDAMFMRLLEELVEMAGTCSTGFITRLINVFSGFDYKFGIRISFREQIEANFTHKFQKALFNIPERYKREVAYFTVTQLLSHENKKCLFQGMYDETQVREMKKIYPELQSYQPNGCDQENVSQKLDLFFEIHIPMADCISEYQFQTTEDVSFSPENNNFHRHFIQLVKEDIRNELQEEFKGHMSKTDIDVYIESCSLIL